MLQGKQKFKSLIILYLEIRDLLSLFVLISKDFLNAFRVKQFVAKNRDTKKVSRETRVKQIEPIKIL